MFLFYSTLKRERIWVEKNREAIFTIYSSYRKGYQDGATDIVDLLKYGLLKDCKTIEDVYKKLKELKIVIKKA